MDDDVRTEAEKVNCDAIETDEDYVVVIKNLSKVCIYINVHLQYYYSVSVGNA